MLDNLPAGGLPSCCSVPKLNDIKQRPPTEMKTEQWESEDPCSPRKLGRGRAQVPRSSLNQRSRGSQVLPVLPW